MRCLNCMKNVKLLETGGSWQTDTQTMWQVVSKFGKVTIFYTTLLAQYPKCILFRMKNKLGINIFKIFFKFYIILAQS